MESGPNVYSGHCPSEDLEGARPGNVILCGQDLQQFSLELINMRVIGEKLIISAPAGLSSRNRLKRIKRKQVFTYINV